MKNFMIDCRIEQTDKQNGLKDWTDRRITDGANLMSRRRINRQDRMG